MLSISLYKYDNGTAFRYFFKQLIYVCKDKYINNGDSVTKLPCNVFLVKNQFLFISKSGALNTLFCALSNGMIGNFEIRTNQFKTSWRNHHPMIKFLVRCRKCKIWANFAFPAPYIFLVDLRWTSLNLCSPTEDPFSDWLTKSTWWNEEHIEIFLDKQWINSIRLMKKKNKHMT
jgi:hypothetical protein